MRKSYCFTDGSWYYYYHHHYHHLISGIRKSTGDNNIWAGTLKNNALGFPGGPAVGNQSANAGDMGFRSLGQGLKDARQRKYKYTGKTESWKTLTFPVSETGWMMLASSSRTLFYCCDWFCGWFLGGWASGRRMFIECLLCIRHSAMFWIDGVWLSPTTPIKLCHFYCLWDLKPDLFG